MSYTRTILHAPPLEPHHESDPPAFVSRAGHKLEAALAVFDLNPAGRVCADLGANVGGFTDCLLKHGAARVYAVDTAYGVIAWTLRKDPRVVVKDRTNALHFKLIEPVSLVSVDVGWTRQEKILPAVAQMLGTGTADVLTLVKPHYESAAAKTQRGVLTAEQSEEVLWQVMDAIDAWKDSSGRGWKIRGIVQSPLEGQKGNVEYVAWLTRDA
jgi:23S rRNA (cytidine1920-2'-O)/16S rRNA (cytidine1409-2'-O)-methyltransferase